MFRVQCVCESECVREERGLRLSLQCSGFSVCERGEGFALEPSVFRVQGSVSECVRELRGLRFSLQCSGFSV